MRRLLVLLLWLPFTFATLIISFFAYQQVSQIKKWKNLIKKETTRFTENPYMMYSALPASVNRIAMAIQTGDARPIIIKQYLEKYHSPLAPYANYIFNISEKYGLDYRLLIALAQQESNLCKKIPIGSHNCWGWGIHSRGTLRFNSYDKAIEAVAKGLKENFIDKGLVTPEQIMSRYCPLSDGSWAVGIKQFMKEME